jgi:hypothetical protein
MLIKTWCRFGHRRRLNSYDVIDTLAEAMVAQAG